jgi:hypothetical protein
MIRMFVRHQVKDYDAWRKFYDDFAPAQKSMGVMSEAVYQSVDDPEDVTVTHDFDTIDQARAFVESAELREGMQLAGVVGTPSLWFTGER